MPRNRQAFSQLKRQVATSGFVAAPGTAPAKYLDWLTKPDIKKGSPKTQKVTTAGKVRLKAALIPFSFEGTDIATARKEMGYITKHSATCIAPGLITGFSTVDSAMFNGLSFSKTDLGVAAPTAKDNENAGFYSAQIIVRAQGTDTAAVSEKTSGITGRKYKYRNTGCAMAPFGKVAATDNMMTRAGVLGAAVSAKSTAAAKLMWSYNPEVLRGQKDGGAIA